MKATRMLLAVVALVALAGCESVAPATGPDPDGAPPLTQADSATATSERGGPFIGSGG